ncbi:DNA repair protein RAD50.L-like isoform X2 [Dysidea avara]|uniref:DNA repair protein RAD50.L-like isoform X2 n=1 Tax=Dysidea avara TaxID=196820 RepID=UPI0033169445
MSMIKRLSIQGIRCYAPGEDQRVEINFRTPLTVIYGANGTGKTTIIECLKYVATGDMPPNSKGGAFVYDPNIAGKCEVMAQVKLEFKDTAKNEVTCSRSLRATQKDRGPLKNETIDSSMLKIEDGKKIKITSRCGDMNSEMARRLGVSKAVLKNVLFCHQEDSYWPLSEGKAVKDVFDEIFASTRYTKALEKVRKLQQEQNSDCKVYRSQLPFLKDRKEEAAKIQANLSEVQKEIESSQASISDIDEQLKPIEDELNELAGKQMDFNEKNQHITALRSKKEQLEKNQWQLQEKIGHTITDSLVEVQCSHKDYEKQVEKEKKQLQECEISIKQLESEKERVDEKRDQLLKDQGRWRSKAEDNKKNVNDRNCLVCDLSTKHGIDVSSNQSQSSAEQFLSLLTQQRKSKERTAHTKQEECSEKITALQNQLNTLKADQAKYNGSKEIKSGQMKENETKTIAIDEELKNIAELDTTTIEAVERELQEAEDKLKKLQENTDAGSLEYTSLQNQRKLIDDRVSKLEEELGKLYSLTTLKKRKKETESTVNNLMTGMEETLRQIFDVMPTVDALESELCTKKQSCKKKLKSLDEKLRQTQERKTKLVFHQDILSEKMENLKKEKDELQLKIHKVCNGNDYQFLVTKVQEDIESIQANIAALQGSVPFLKECLEKAQTSKKCPVCTRSLDSWSDMETVINMLSSRITESIPRQLHDHLKEHQEKHKCLQNLKPSIDQLEKIDSDKTPSNNKVLLSTNKELQSVDGELQKLKAEILPYNNTLKQIHSIEPKMSILLHHYEELKKQEQKVVTEEDKLGDLLSAGRNDCVVREERQNALKEQKEVGIKMDHKYKEMELEGKILKLQEKKIKIIESMKRRDELAKQKADLMSRTEKLKMEIEEIDNNIKTIQRKNEVLEAKIELVKREMNEACAQRKAEVDEICSNESKLEWLVQEINSYHQFGEEQKLKQCEDEVTKCDQTTKEHNQKRSALQNEVDRMREKQANVMIKLREYKDTIQYLEQRDEINGIDEEIREIDTYLREHGIEDYDGKCNKRKEDTNILKEKRAHQKGLQSSWEDNAQQLQQNLDGESYKDAETKYLCKAAEIKAIEVTNSDLNKFYKALDRAITQYHQAKMDEVNKNIQELWIQIYKGGDIDNIEIQSDNELEEHSDITARRRVFHYRVVMHKGNRTKMNMRGRCSAGQKMLASLVIRLALAETFCFHCGVLALDEPTTNLDEENSKALAEALSDMKKKTTSKLKVKGNARHREQARYMPLPIALRMWSG